MTVKGGAPAVETQPMDLSRVLGEFYDEHDDDVAPAPAAAGRDVLAAALSEAVAEPGAEPAPQPDDLDAEPAVAAHQESVDDAWLAAPAPLAPAVAVGPLEEPTEGFMDEPAPVWHRGDDDVLAPRRKGSRIAVGRRRS